MERKNGKQENYEALEELNDDMKDKLSVLFGAMTNQIKQQDVV